MTVAVHIKVKFRAWGITFGTVERTASYTFTSVPRPPVPMEKVLMDDRGVYIKVTLS